MVQEAAILLWVQQLQQCTGWVALIPCSTSGTAQNRFTVFRAHVVDPGQWSRDPLFLALCPTAQPVLWLETSNILWCNWTFRFDPPDAVQQAHCQLECIHPGPTTISDAAHNPYAIIADSSSMIWHSQRESCLPQLGLSSIYHDYTELSHRVEVLGFMKSAAYLCPACQFHR